MLKTFSCTTGRSQAYMLAGGTALKSSQRAMSHSFQSMFMAPAPVAGRRSGRGRFGRRKLNHLSGWRKFYYITDCFLVPRR